MNSKEVKELIENHTKDLIDICPHCWAKVHIEKLWSDYHSFRNWDLEFYITFRCKPCKKLLLKTFYFEENKYSPWVYHEKWWFEKFPLSLEFELTQEDLEYIPNDVFSDYKEALKCKSIDSYKASCSMFRRCLQNSLLELWVKNDDDLIKQINSLNNLPNDIKDWAHQIRIFWNWWTHPDKDNLKDVDKDITEEVHDFISKFLMYVFIMPKKVSLSREKRDKILVSEKI